MDGVASNESKNAQLGSLLNSSTWANAYMGLSTYSGPIDETTVAGTLLGDELSGGGYARQQLTTWATPTQPVPGTSQSSAAAVTFTNSAPADTPAIYCWFVVNQSSGHLLQAGQYGVPFVISGSGGTYTTTPFVKLGALSP